MQQRNVFCHFRSMLIDQEKHNKGNHLMKVDVKPLNGQATVSAIMMTLFNYALKTTRVQMNLVLSVIDSHTLLIQSLFLSSFPFGGKILGGGGAGWFTQIHTWSVSSLMSPFKKNQSQDLKILFILQPPPKTRKKSNRQSACQNITS